MDDAESLFSFEDVDEGRSYVVIDDVEPNRDGLVEWYGENKRDLPWRKGRAGYGVWVSEVMLQQTKVGTVVEYWKKWMERFPCIEDVAKASVDDVKGLWAGLGYYRRAENLHKGCQYVVAHHKGVLPVTSIPHLLKIPSIGAYTAAAIASISGCLPTPSVDGNFIRVISRWQGLLDMPQNPKSIPKIEKIAKGLISTTHPGEWNQCIMDIGATICTPLKANCAQCPLAGQCKAKSMLEQKEIPQIEGLIPLKKEKAKTTAQTWEVYVLFVGEGEVLLVKRVGKGLLAGMWEFPNNVKKGDEGPQKKKQKCVHVLDRLGVGCLKDSKQCAVVYHQFTHIDCTMHVHRVDVPEDMREVLLNHCTQDGVEPVVHTTADILEGRTAQTPVSEQMKKALRACV